MSKQILILAGDGIGPEIVKAAEQVLTTVNDKFNLSVGTEVEVSNNFYKGRAYVIPTLALKWTLN